MKSCHVARIACWLSAITLSCATVPACAEGESPLYRCPGDLYTNSLTAREAHDKGCRTLEGAPITIIAPPKRAGTPVPVSKQPSDNRIDPSVQKARDSDARRILETELRRDEERLAELRKEYNAGEPERRGDERNYQKYLDRTAELKAAIARKENDIAAIKRELTKVAP